MAVRSSPRLHAILCSNSLGKPAVFVPLLSRVATGRTLRSRKKVEPGKCSKEKPCLPSKYSQEKKSSSEKSTQDKAYPDGVGLKITETVCENTGSCNPKRSSTLRSSQNVLTSAAKNQTSSSRTKKSKVSRSVRGRKSKGNVDNEQGKADKDLESSVYLSRFDRVSNGDAPTSTTSLNIKRKRGRPPKRATCCKRAKITSSKSKSKMASSAELADSSLLKSEEDVIDLTCDDETIGEDVDAAVFVPSSFTTPDLTKRSTHSLTSSSEMAFTNKGVGRGDSDFHGDSNSSMFDTDSDYLRTSLHSEESVAQLFDLSLKQDRELNLTFGANTTPSLKNSKDSTGDEVISWQTLHCKDEAIISVGSPTEEEYPQPSTPQQKLLRRLARQKQLEEMRAREAAILREERLLRRKGNLLSPQRDQSSAKRISWKDDTDLVEMFIYAPVREDDDDTVSIHSDDANNMEAELSVT